MTTKTTIVYPDSDGMPLPDGEFQAPIYANNLVTLKAHFADVQGAWVNGNTFIYYIEGDPRRSVSPDCYVALNLSEEALASIERNNVYLMWEVGKAPDFVLEIGSPSTGRTDLGRKRDLYASLGVREYWRFDSTGGDFYGEPLVGELLTDGEYQRLDMRRESDGRVWHHSELLGLDLWWMDGELRFWDIEEERWLLTYDEQLARADEERARADEESARANAEYAARVATETRIAELEAELARLRDA